MNRRSRTAWAWLALLALLFAQLGVSAYACADSAGMSIAASAHPCEGIDATSPGLCDRHCNGDQQSGPQAISLAPFFPSFVTLVQPADRVSFIAVPRPELRHATSPPPTISHCRWRI
jgi:hypothetical protein